MNKLLSILFTLVACVAGANQNTITVKLETESSLLPIVLKPLINQRSDFNNDYLKELQKILEFDLSHNGKTALVNAKGSYEISLNAHENKLDAIISSLNSNQTKKLENLELCGILNHDRRQIHQIADTIHKELFGIEGIASSRFLYTIRAGTEPGKWGSDVWEADYDGANARQITKESGYSITPVYVPPKTGFSSANFVYVSYKTGQPKIYYQSLKGGEQHRLSYLRGNQLMPVMSPQRDKLAFISDVTGNPDLFILPFSPEEGATGKPYQIFATHKATQGSPTFSPDGKKIAFVSNKDGSPRIYMMDIPPPGKNIKDLKVSLITKLNGESTAPAWSPDGSKIAYCALTKGVRQIWVYDLETKLEKQLTQGPGHKENPAWAANSLHLLYNGTGQNASELYLINLNQSVATKVSSGPGEKRFPNWQTKP